MNKTYALESRHSARYNGVTRYLMPGGRHQFTRSTKWARTFTSFEEACTVAQKVGGVKVVEVEVQTLADENSSSIQDTYKWLSVLKGAF